MDRIEISISKRKILILLIGAMLFIISGIFFIITPETFISILIRNPQMIRSVGVFAVIFFSAAGIYGLKKLFDKKFGLIIDENGIIDNTNASSVGLIEWNDIIEIKTEQVMSTRFMLIFIDNPDKYLEGANGFKRKLLKGNSRMYGTPLSITSNTLNCSFDDLEQIINERFLYHKERRTNEFNRQCLPNSN